MKVQLEAETCLEKPYQRRQQVSEPRWEGEIADGSIFLVARNFLLQAVGQFQILGDSFFVFFLDLVRRLREAPPIIRDGY